MTTGKDFITNRKALLAGVLALAAAGVGIVVLTTTAEDTSPNQGEQSSDMLALGRDVYRSQCAVCHGGNLEGQPNWRTRKANGRLPAPPHDATGHTWHHDDATLFNLTKYGLAALIGQPVETDMPAYDGILSDDEIRAVLAYIKSQWPAHIQQRQQELTDRALRKAGS